MPRKTLKQRQQEAESRDTIGSRILERAGVGQDPDCMLMNYSLNYKTMVLNLQ